MPSKARAVLPGVCCHVTQRGNYGQETFFGDADREAYLQLVATYAEEYGLQLLGWCLMQNHVHWIVCPEKVDSLSRTFQRAHSHYAQRVNRQYQLASGHLWQNRFYSCLLGERHIWRALAYVERNPVRARLVKRSTEYQWSSARVHTGQTPPPLWINMSLWEHHYTAEEWSVALRQTELKEDQKLREATRLNRAWAGPGAIRQWEEVIGLRLGRARPGRRPATI